MAEPPLPSAAHDYDAADTRRQIADTRRQIEEGT